MTKHSKVFALFLAVLIVFVFALAAQEQTDETAVCPVSGKQIKKSEAKATYEYEGKTYYFCCEKCKEEFMKSPEKYTQKKAEMKEVYTCPMHPEVQSDKPGKCPQCGMNLEKKMMPAGHMHGEEHMHKHMKMHKEGKACCAMMGIMKSGDVEVAVENVDNGVVVKITSKNADVAKKIQEKAVKMSEMCAKKEDCSKKEKKKEEVKK